MRDKVKRFISILMTALMLVNLLPVGALAEGMKLDSNSVQSRASKKSANVYVYVKVTGDKAGLTINQSGWYTIGKSENVPGMGTPYWSMHGSHSFSDVGVSYKTVLKTNFTRWTDNQKIDLDQITWTEFYVDNGADDYVKAGTYTWHMNGTIDIKQLPSVYTIKYVDYDTKELIHSYEESGLMGQTPKKITAPDSWQENLYSFYFVNGHPKEQTVDFKKDKGELTFYYKKNTANYTVNYYLNGTTTKVAAPKKGTAALGSSVTESPITVDGYTPVSGDSKKITIKANSDENVINFYYYKNVELTANSDTATYDGNEHSVSGFTGKTVKEEKTVTLSFDSVNVPEVTRKDAGTDTVAFNENPVGKVDTTEKYIVTKATDGQLVISKRPVTLTSASDKKVYDGNALTNDKVTVSGDGFVEGEGATYKVTGTQTNVGKSKNTFTYELNGNTKAINYTITTAEGELEVTAVTDEVVVTITGHNSTVTYNGSEQSVNGYDVSIAPEGVSYTTADFSFNGTAEAKGTDAGTYQMGLKADQFANTNGNFKKVTFVVNDGKLTINPVDEVVVTITGHNDTVPYDGTEHTVTGYDVSISNDLYKEGDFTFSGSAVVKGTDAGTYQMGLNDGQFTNNNDNFKKVTFVVNDGKLTINPVDEVVVTITGHNDTVPYDGTEHTVTGYDVSISNDLYKEGDFTFSGTAEAKGTNAGTYQMGLKADQFANTNGNFKKVTFVVNDGKLTINPVDEVVVTITGHNDTVPYDGTEHTVTGYDVSISNDLYKEGDFTFSGTAEAKGTDAGTYPMGLKAEQFSNNNENFKKVTFVVEDGSLTIRKRNVVLTSETASKTYDGTPLTRPNVTVSTGENEGFVEGEVSDVKATGSVTYVSEGEVTNTITYTEGEKFNADNYDIQKTEGKLSINPVTDKVTVTITEKSGTATYDGKEHIVSGYKSMTADNELYDVDASVQETPTAAWTVKGKDAGEYPVGIKADDFKNTNGNFTNVKFVVVDGKLTITPAPVTLQAPIASKTYDGEPLEATQFGHSYLEGVNFADDFASVILTGSQTLVGSSASLITGVIPNEGKKLTNYNFTFVPGTLTVTDGTGEEEKPVDPAKVITKTHTPKDMGYNLGEPVTFTISVKNIYNTPKTITLTEKANVKFSNGENVIVFKDVPAGETVTAEATYMITSEDILEGVFHNTVTATFGDKSWDAKDEVETAELDTTLNVTKTSDVPDGQKAALGQKITYTIKVQNAGNVPYTNVKVEDPLTKLTATIETLPVGETRTFTTEYVVTEADVLKGSVLNTATATGDEIKDPKSDEPKEPNGGDEVETPTFAPITLKPKDVTATYNGAAITGKDVEITSGKLLEGHKLSAAVIGSGVNAGSYELTLDPEKITIVDANNKDVSEMYARTLLPGKLIINKRSVLITSQSATKTYDGSALTRPAVTITGDGFVPGELAKAEATGSITNVGSTPNTIRYTTTGAFNAANYSIALSVGTLTVTEKPKPEPRRTFNLTISYVYQNGKRAAASYNRGGLKNGETFDITSPVIAGYTASETVVSGTIYNRDIKVTVIYTADGVNLDDYGVPLGLGNITMNVGDCFE